MALMTPRRFRASTVNSRTPPVYRRLKPAVNTTRAWFAATELIIRPGVVEGGAHPGGRHRQFGQAPVDRTVDRVGDRRHRRHDVDLADPLGAERGGPVRHP